MDSVWLGVVIGVGTSLVAGLLLHLLLNRENDSHVSVKVFDPSDSYTSSNFYILLNKAIAGAKEEVVQYAEGFSTDLPERHEKAKAFVDTVHTALRARPDLKWIRIQTKNPFDEQWMVLLQALHKEFPAQFKLFLFDNRIGDHLLSVVLVDPRSRQNRVFLLISKPRHVGGDTKVNIAHTGVMIKGSRILSDAFYDRLNDLRDPKSQFVTPVTPDSSVDDFR